MANAYGDGISDKMDDWRNNEYKGHRYYDQEEEPHVNPNTTKDWGPGEETVIDEDEPIIPKEERLSQEEIEAIAEEDRRAAQVAEEILSVFPDLEEISLEDLERDFEMKPIMGETDGCEDPLDAPWRIEAQQIIKDVTEQSGLELYDVLWSLREVEVTVTARADDLDGLTVDKLSNLARSLNDALEVREDDLRVLSRHELIVATPGSPDLLTTERQFEAFKGFDVIVKTWDPEDNPREILGKLVDRTTTELTINLKGRIVTIPCTLIEEVRLPPALIEDGDAAELKR